MKTITRAEAEAINARDKQAFALAATEDITFSDAWLRLLPPTEDPQPIMPARGRIRQGRLF